MYIADDIYHQPLLKKPSKKSEVFQEIVSTVVSRWISQELAKNRGIKSNTDFSRKSKMEIHHLSPCSITTVGGSGYQTIYSSILQEIFSSISKCLLYNREKTDFRVEIR